MDKDDRALVEETRAIWDEIDAGDTDRAAWMALQDRLGRMLEFCGAQVEVARRLDRAASQVSAVLRWEHRSASTPYAKGTPEAKRIRRTSNRAAAKKVMADPEEREKVIDSLEPGVRAEVREAIDAKDDEEFFADEGKKKGHRKAKRREAVDEARARTERAWLNLGARYHYYADVPFRDGELAHLRQIYEMAGSLLAGEELDAELRELVADAQK